MKKLVRLAVLVLCAVLFIVPSGPSDKQIERTALFNVAFPLAGWAGDKGEFRNEPDFCKLEYRFEDEHSEGAASFSMLAMSGRSLDYRDLIMTLKEIADRTTLDETRIGGVTFSYADYGEADALYRMYIARVPESNINIKIMVNKAPGAFYDVQPILDTIHFTLPVLSPAHIDPPLPEDSSRYVPQPEKIRLGDRDIQAAWLPTDEPWLVKKSYPGKIAVTGDTLYTLLGRQLYAHSIRDGRLLPSITFPDGILKLRDDYYFLSMTGDGTLFVSNVNDETFSIKEGAITPYNNQVGQGRLAMHPGGKWGICFDGLDVTERVQLNPNGLPHESWTPLSLGSQQDATMRFDYIDTVSITNDRVYVAGYDAVDDRKVVSAYQLDGSWLFDLGAKSSSYPDHFITVTDMVQTQDCIVLLDNIEDVLQVFYLDGSYQYTLPCDGLLGTDDAYILSITPAEDGLYLAAAQVRDDFSCTELLLFHVTGL